MKKLIKLLLQCLDAFRTLGRFGAYHEATRLMLTQNYIREWMEPDNSPVEIKVAIQREGSFYRVTRSYYRNELLQKNEDWICTYGWHSNGHLIPLGAHRYLIFDTDRQLMYIEDWTNDDKTLEIFRINQTS